MRNKEETRVNALVAISDLMGRDYFLSHFEGSANLIRKTTLTMRNMSTFLFSKEKMTADYGP